MASLNYSPWCSKNDMIAALMSQKYRNGEYLTDKEISHMMIALLMAGQHTSSATGSWALLHIAANPEIGYVHHRMKFIMP